MLVSMLNVCFVIYCGCSKQTLYSGQKITLMRVFSPSFLWGRFTADSKSALSTSFRL